MTATSDPAHADSRDADRYARQWVQLFAPQTGNLRQELATEAAEYLSVPLDDVLTEMAQGTERLADEWRSRVQDSRDPTQVIGFYNESDAELFEQLQWHATDVLHHRSLICAELSSQLPGRRAFLDFGAGVGSNALVFAAAGFDVTIADVADPLQRFATWRFRRRNVPVKVIDLKRERLPSVTYDVITCFDVLEHVPDPVRIVKELRDAMRPGGLLFLYAPFGEDPERPMHIVHDDRVFRLMRFLGFRPKGEWEDAFPSTVRAPSVYTRSASSSLDRFGYYMYDVWMKNRIGDAIAAWWRRQRRHRR